jgi:hypothetical protein
MVERRTRFGEASPKNEAETRTEHIGPALAAAGAKSSPFAATGRGIDFSRT